VVMFAAAQLLLAFVWLKFSRPQRAALAGETPEARASRSRPARVSVAKRGLLALGPVVAAFATGITIYGIELAGSAPSRAVIWVHAGIATLVFLLATYKLRAVGLKALREGLKPGRLLTATSSLVMSALLVPLGITGVVLLIFPGHRSFVAYSHLVTSAWWTALLLWHLHRHLGDALNAVRLGERKVDSIESPAKPRGRTVERIPPRLAGRARRRRGGSLPRVEGRRG
jgi:hypothetical protein